MDQTTTKPPLSHLVKECLDAGLSVEDGSKYVNMYHNGYSIVTRLIRIQQQHADPQVRAKAQDYLNEIDLNGGIGTIFRAAYRFSMLHKIKIKPNRQKYNKGMRRLSSFEHSRITEFVSRSDLSEDEHSEIKRIQASILDNKISSVDYAKLKQIAAKYLPVIHAAHGNKKAGWSKMDEKTYRDVEVLLDRPDVSDPDKKRIYKLMDGIKEGKIQTVDYFEIAKILADNRASKKERAKRSTASKTFENAVFMACQACDNLDDMKVPVLPKAARIDLVAKISWAVGNLIRLQYQLIQEEEDEGRNQRGLCGSEEPVSDLAPVSAPVPGGSCAEDSE